MKRPAFQFYPSDHRGETGLQLSSLAARGLWSEMICVMHEGVPYGHLTTAAGQPIEPAQLARLVGESPAVTKRLLDELEANNVFSRNEEGAIYSRRMVRDEHIREVRAEAGKKGGNPALTGKRRDKQGGSGLLKQTSKQSAEQNPTPSSSVFSLQRNKGTSVPSSADADLTAGGSWMWDLWVAEFGADLPGRSYTKTRREKFTGYFNEHLRDVDDPRAEFARALKSIRTHRFWGDKPNTWDPAKCMRNAERREELALGIPSDRTPATNGNGRHPLEMSDREFLEQEEVD